MDTSPSLQCQVQLNIPGDQVMNGFCYDFARALLNKASLMWDSEQIFKGDVPDKYGAELLDEALSILEMLSNQVGYSRPIILNSATEEEVLQILHVAKEVLSTFEVDSDRNCRKTT